VGRPRIPPTLCKVPGCEDNAHAGGYCCCHYQRVVRGKPLGPKKKPALLALAAVGFGWSPIKTYKTEKSADANAHYIRCVAKKAGMPVEVRRVGLVVEARSNAAAPQVPATVEIVGKLERGEQVDKDSLSTLAAVHRLLADIWVRHYAGVDRGDCRCHEDGGGQ
jgi:hypothetical protein